MTFLDPNKYSRAQAYDPLDGFGDEISENKNLKKFVYDFSVLGGAIGAVQLLDDQGNPAVLPVGSIIQRAYLDVVVSAASGGAATIAIGALASNDILAATAFGSIAAGLVEAKQTGTMANALKISSGNVNLQRPNFSVAAQKVSVTIAAATLTAGKFYLYCEIVRSSLT